MLAAGMRYKQKRYALVQTKTMEIKARQLVGLFYSCFLWPFTSQSIAFTYILSIYILFLYALACLLQYHA